MGITKRLLVVGFTLIATHLLAQLPIDGVHYPVGLDGIKAGIPESPGIYVRDDNWFYFETEHEAGDLHTFVYMQAPQAMWLTDWKVIGANIGADLMIPFIYKNVSDPSAAGTTPGGRFPTGTTSWSQFNVGDIKLEPLLLAWHWDQWDLMAAGAVWVPSGSPGPGDHAALGDHVWAPMISLGAVWHPDEGKTWSLSILHHYEWDHGQNVSVPETAPGGGFPIAVAHTVNCSTYTLELAAGKTIFDHTDLGVNAYFQKQFSDDGKTVNLGTDSAVAGAGPEVSVTIPKWDLTADLRYDYEFEAHDRPRGDVIDLSLTKKF